MVGLVNGSVISYDSSQEKLKPLKIIHCKNSGGKFNNGRKVNGIEFLDKIFAMVTTNDSRIRFINLKVKFSLFPLFRMVKYFTKLRDIKMKIIQFTLACQKTRIM